MSIFSTSVCEKMFGEELGPGNEPCEGWNQPVLLTTPSLEPPVSDKCNCHEWDELVPEFIADFARVHKPDGGRMELAREATAVRETGETEAIHALIAAHHRFGKRLSDMQLALLSQNRTRLTSASPEEARRRREMPLHVCSSSTTANWFVVPMLLS